MLLASPKPITAINSNTMTGTNQPPKKKKITYSASLEGVKRAENALKRLGFESKSNFAESQLISRSTVTKFFNRQSIQLDSFKRICEPLKLKWEEIAGLTEKKKFEGLQATGYSSRKINKELVEAGITRRQVTVLDKDCGTIKVQITLQGDINSVSNLRILESILREHSGDTIRIIDIQAGSIKLTIEGSQEDIERLLEGIGSGELTEINGFPVQNIQVLSENPDDSENNQATDKWYLVREIVQEPNQRRDLRGVDLSDTDLRDADLSGVDLTNADLSGADLSGVD